MYPTYVYTRTPTRVVPFLPQQQPSLCLRFVAIYAFVVMFFFFQINLINNIYVTYLRMAQVWYISRVSV